MPGDRELAPSGRVFFGLGNDARAKSVVNGLLSKHPADRLLAESRLDTWADPQIARDVAGVAAMRGFASVSRVRDLFMEVMVETAMQAEAKTKAKAPRARKAKAKAEAPAKAEDNGRYNRKLWIAGVRQVAYPSR